MSRRRTIIVMGFAGLSLFVMIALILIIDYSRQNMIVQRPLIDVAFEHSKHKKEQCATCHHNYVDDSSGSGGCYDCHKYSEKTEQLMEATFHQFCRDCHLNKAIDGLDGGPLRQCSLCHIDDQIVD